MNGILHKVLMTYFKVRGPDKKYDAEVENMSKEELKEILDGVDILKAKDLLKPNEYRLWAAAYQRYSQLEGVSDAEDIGDIS